jgi:tryptophan halogenase
MIKSLCIAGGGNAGLMAALYLKAAIPSLKITLIKSDKIGTVGVGEGATEHWDSFSHAVGIHPIDILLECGATFKNGLKFENWNGDGKSYWHSIPEYMAVIDPYTGIPYTMLRLMSEGIDPEEFSWDKARKGLVGEPVEVMYTQFHFDSEKLNKFLTKICLQRNINIIDTVIIDAILDSNGYVSHVVDQNNQNYYADFFIDSTGFKKIIASKLGGKWIDYKEYLPVNSAIAFPTGYKEEIPTYTLSKALSSGWQWRSPIQDRFGNGYVFCDDFITDDQAIAEIQKEYDEEIQVGRKIKFVSGHLDRFWIKNCVSIGLSSSFIEPLEASSISTTVQQLKRLAPALITWERNDASTVKIYNDEFTKVAHNILDFVQLHYITKREDTEFWKHCKHNIKLTDFNKNNLEIFKKNFINQLTLPTTSLEIFDILDWAQVMYGLDLFDKTRLTDIYNSTCKHLHERSIQECESVDVPGRVFHTSRQAINLIKSKYG